MSLALETRATTTNCCNTSSTNSGASGAYKFQPSPGIIQPFMAAMFGTNQDITGMFSPMGGGGGKFSPICDGGGEKKKNGGDSDSCTSSSIGRNSDLSITSGDDDDSGENEAQSNLKGPLDTMDSLEDVLPVKKGISSFYSGKSKSFTSLADVSMISSINEIAKPEDIYSKKRKNMLALTVYLEKLDDNSLKRQASETRDSHRNHAAEAIAASLVGFSKDIDKAGGDISNASSRSSSPSSRLPPLRPRKKSSPTKNQEVVMSMPEQQKGFPPCRSFSLCDLRSVSASSSSSGSGHSGVE